MESYRNSKSPALWRDFKIELGSFSWCFFPQFLQEGTGFQQQAANAGQDREKNQTRVPQPLHPSRQQLSRGLCGTCSADRRLDFHSSINKPFCVKRVPASPFTQECNFLCAACNTAAQHSSFKWALCFETRAEYLAPLPPSPRPAGSALTHELMEFLKWIPVNFPHFLVGLMSSRTLMLPWGSPGWL